MTVFVSSSHENRQQAQRLADALEQRGLEVVAPEPDACEIGSFNVDLTAALREASAVAFVLGPTISRRQRAELTATLEDLWTRHPDKKILPLLLPGAERPAALAEFAGLDLSQEVSPAEADEVAKAVRSEPSAARVDQQRIVQLDREWRDRLAEIKEMAEQWRDAKETLL